MAAISASTSTNRPVASAGGVAFGSLGAPMASAIWAEMVSLPTRASSAFTASLKSLSVL